MHEKGIDVIIPVFKISGLERSLRSIPSSSLVRVTIVDDGQFNDYSDILNAFKDSLDIRILQLPKNVGQGLARQKGIDNSNKEVVFFLDCGDVICYKNEMEKIYNIFLNNKSICFTDNYTFAEKINGEKDKYKLCVMGQFYRRSFLDYYKIRFCDNDTASRKMEDIAFNTLCWFVRENSLEQIDFYENSIPICTKIEEVDSISCSNNGEYNYRDRNIGYAVNYEYCLEKLDDLKTEGKITLPKLKRKKLWTIGIINCYAIYKNILDFHPEYSDYALEGLNYFLNSFLQQYEDVDFSYLKKNFLERFELTYDHKIDDLEKEYEKFAIFWESAIKHI